MSKEDRIIELLENIDRKLAVMLGEKVKQKHEIIKEQVEFLHKKGMKNKEIAAILNITPKHVSKELSIIRKKVKK